MERESDKHSPRVDEEMKKETRSFTQGAPVESRAQESREKEGPADGEPTPDEVIATESASSSMSHEELETRQDIARYIEGSIFPTGRDEIIDDARRMGAPQEVVARLKQLPAGRYESFRDVWQRLSA